MQRKDQPHRRPDFFPNAESQHRVPIEDALHLTTR